MPIMLEIKGVFNLTSIGVIVVARKLDPTQNFRITEKSHLGGIKLAKFLDIPRSIDENGKQRDVVALQLKDPADKEKIAIGSILELRPGDMTE